MNCCDYFRYVCDDCSKRYSTKRFLRQHIETAHLKLKPDYKCTICDKVDFEVIFLAFPELIE